MEDKGNKLRLSATCKSDYFFRFNFRTVCFQLKHSKLQKYSLGGTHQIFEVLWICHKSVHDEGKRKSGNKVRTCSRISAKKFSRWLSTKLRFGSRSKQQQRESISLSTMAGIRGWRWLLIEGLMRLEHVTSIRVSTLGTDKTHTFRT